MRFLVVLQFFFFLLASGALAQVSSAIRVNQLGFYPFAPKIAVIADVPQGRFYIRRTGNDKALFSGKLGSSLKSDYSSKSTRIADFSAFTDTGDYEVFIPGTGASYPFRISSDVLHPLAKAVMKAYYFQRVSVPLLPQYAGKWARNAGHPDTAVMIHPSAASPSRPAGSFISSPGGWYDAGDYNKYIVNNGITMGTLLSLCEEFPDYIKTLNLNIPESSNNVPDMLDEILYNLRWMLTMQDPSDGGVYNKLTNASFDGMVMPGITKTPRYVVQKGTAAALDFAAVMAQASRVIKQYRELAILSDSCLAASQKAWVWAAKNANLPYDQNAMNTKFEPQITTGGYGDKSFTDEFIWAASELYLTTGDDKYYESVNMFPDSLMPLPSWGNVRLLGYYSLARNQKLLKGKAKIDFSLIKKQILAMADDLAKDVHKSPYNTVMGTSRKDFVWGSNSVAANQGVAMLQAFYLSGDKKYLNCALANLDYLLGRNATGYSFVTGYGFRTPMHPHHRPSVADGITEPVPGLLAGGPNPGKQDGLSLPGNSPDEAYIDDQRSYATNEIAINWNAPLVYISNAIDALKHRAGYVK